MKKIILVLLCLPLFGTAQKLIGGSNIIRWNLGSLAFKNYHFTYERNILPHISASISYRTQPKGAPPFQAQLKEVLNSSDINFDHFEMGNTALTGEARFYIGLGKMKGFYLAPYLRMASFDLTAPIKYSSGVSSKEASFVGKIKSTSGGLMLGWQFQIFTKLVLDLQIIGGHYGTSKGDLNFTPTSPLNGPEITALQESLNNIDAKPFKFTSTVTSSGAVIKTDGPWAGIRGANIGIGLRF